MKVYKYGLLPPTANASLVREQMRTAGRYYNRLIEIERDRRREERALLESHLGMQWLGWAAKYNEEECEALVRTISAARAATRSRSESAELRERLVEAKRARKEALRTLAFGRALVRVSSDCAAIYERASQARKAARADCGVYWGTYLLTEAASEAAIKDTPLYDGTAPNDPGFHRWDGSGQVSVQLQGGMSVAEAFSGEDTRLRLVAAGESKGGRRKFFKLFLRVGSDGRDAVWAEWPMVLHRPIPEQAVIKVATVSCRRDGPFERWSVEITINDSAVQLRPSTATAEIVGFDIGWRVFGDELRVGYWSGSDGAEQDIRLDAEMVRQLTKAASLRSIRDKNFNEARDALCLALQGRELPEWMRARTVRRGETTPSSAQALAWLGQWRSQKRLAQLWWAWKDARFDSDEEPFAALRAWEKQDRHLLQWECQQRHQGLERRKHFYRNLAADLARRYKCVALEKFDLSKKAKRAPAGESESSENTQANANRHLVATSVLRDAIKNAFFSRGGEVREVPAAGTTRSCHECGVDVIGDAAKMVVMACSNGHVHDQDLNAARNIRERASGDGGSVAARKRQNDSENADKREGRWTKKKRTKRERYEQKQAARNAQSNPAE